MSAELKRARAAGALADGNSQAEAARRAGVDRSTVKRWVKDPSFQSLIAAASRAVEEPDGDPTDIASEATKGLARLIPIAEAVVEAALKGEEYNGNPVTAQQHSNALKTIELARKLEPRASAAEAGTPSLGELIAAADAARGPRS